MHKSVVSMKSRVLKYNSCVHCFVYTSCPGNSKASSNQTNGINYFYNKLELKDFDNFFILAKLPMKLANLEWTQQEHCEQDPRLANFSSSRILDCSIKITRVCKLSPINWNSILKNDFCLGQVKLIPCTVEILMEFHRRNCYHVAMLTEYRQIQWK